MNWYLKLPYSLSNLLLNLQATRLHTGRF